MYCIEDQELIRLVGKIDALEKKIDSLNVNGNQNTRLLTITDACSLMKVSKRTLQRWRDEGFLTFSQINGKIFFEPSDIQLFLEKHKVKVYQKGGAYGK